MFYIRSLKNYASLNIFSLNAANKWEMNMYWHLFVDLSISSISSAAVLALFTHGLLLPHNRNSNIFFIWCETLDQSGAATGIIGKLIYAPFVSRPTSANTVPQFCFKHLHKHIYI